MSDLEMLMTAFEHGGYKMDRHDYEGKIELVVIEDEDTESYYTFNLDGNFRK